MFKGHKNEEDIKNTAKILAGWGMIVSVYVKEFNQEKSWKNIKKNVSLEEFTKKPYRKDRAEPGNKKVLGKSFPSGPSAFYKVIKMLAEDDHTAKHLSKKLAIHFIGEKVSKQEIQEIYIGELTSFIKNTSTSLEFWNIIKNNK